MTPRVRFMLGGVQKGGTTALAAALARHPAIALPTAKEAHVFDAPDFDDAAAVEGIDARFAGHFDAQAWQDATRLRGDATPITVMHPLLVARVARYNPAMRWIILLRDPVERAISQWHMERARGAERWPAWAAFLFEPLRLRAHRDDFSDGSPLRHHSYLLRSRYRRQCDVLFGHFPAEQVLLLRTEWLSSEPAKVLQAVWRHLGVAAQADDALIPRAFEGGYPRMPAWHPARWIARAALLHDRPQAFIEQACRRG